MAMHNKSRLLGYLPEDPIIKNPDDIDEAMAHFTVAVTHRNPTGYRAEGRLAVDKIPVLCDGNPKIMNIVKTIKKGDFVDIEGLYNVLYTEKESICSECGQHNIKHGISCYVYPLFIQKVDPGFTEEDISFLDDGSKTIDEYLKNIYEEVSNHTLLLGYVAQVPELIVQNCARYCISVDRKVFVPTQSTIVTDYPFVYSYGEQGARDLKYLKEGSLIMIDGFIRNRKVKNRMECQWCGNRYDFDDFSTEIIPYSVEYLNNIKTDTELKLEETLKKFDI